MKKWCLIFLIILCVPTFVIAGSSDDDGVAIGTMIRATCIYRNTTSYSEYGDVHTQYNYSEFDFSGIDATAGGPNAGIKSYYNIDLGNDTVVFEEMFGTSYILNFMNDFGVKFTIDTFMYTQFNKYQTNEETLQKAIDDGEFCPSTVYEAVKNNKRIYMFCNGYNSELNVNTCNKVNEYLNENYSDYSIKKQELYVNTAISNNGQKDLTKTDVKDKYVDVELNKDAACDENSGFYDLEKCNIYRNLSGTLVDQADDQGISKETLYTYKIQQLKPITTDPANCISLFGYATCESGQNCDPAFYIQVVFNVMKYVAIILLIVLSSMDFLGAVTSSDNDAMKKAMNKCIKRLILCVIIFFVPTILEYVFTWIKVYTPTTCGIK